MFTDICHQNVWLKILTTMFPVFQMQSELDRNISKELNNGECTEPGSMTQILAVL